MSYSSRLLNSGPAVLAEHDWINDTFEAVLVDAAHTHDDTDTLFSDISANQVANVALTSKAITNSAANNYLDAGDVDFGGSLAGKYIYIVRRAGVTLGASDLLVSKIDLNDGQLGNITVASALQLNANGLINLAVA